jgi:hypothetical protein
MWAGLGIVRPWLIARATTANAQLALYRMILQQAPCLEGICPGDDRGREVALQRLGHSHYMNGSVQGSRAIVLRFIDQSGELTGIGSMFFSDPLASEVGIVDRIEFGLDELTLGMALHELGEPDEFLFVTGCGQGLRVHAQLLYRARGVVVIIEHEVWSTVAQKLTADTAVEAIEYFRPDAVDSHLSLVLELYITDSVAYALIPTVTQADFIAHFRPWPGLDAFPSPSVDFCPE